MTTLSGYNSTNEFWATKFNQLDLQQISVHLTVDQITSGVLIRPDPTIRLEHNRAIKRPHAEKFADYLLRGAQDVSGKWPVIVPAMSLFISPATAEFKANPDFAVGSSEIEFGVLSLERTSPLQIWDGQHRTLGTYIAVERQNKSIGDLHHLLTRTTSEGDETAASDLEEKIRVAKRVRKRLGSIVIPSSIALETDKKRIGELFADVADNAKGINATALARLDQRSVFNRVATVLYDGGDWTLLAGHIDDDNAYTSMYNEYWTTYRDVADVAKISWIGYGSRWTPKQEDERLASEESEILENVREFYEILVKSFSELEKVLTHCLKAHELRGVGDHKSLLSSSTTIKALASSFHDLKFGKAWRYTGSRFPERLEGLQKLDRSEIESGFKSLPAMRSGSETILDKFWLDLGIFDEPWVAPTARASNARTMSMAITERIRTVL